MTPQERDLILGLFQRLTPPPDDQIDEEARALIERLARERPLATYLLAQTALVQEYALKGAQARIAELEEKLANCAEPAPASGRKSFLSGLFGGDTSAAQDIARRPTYQDRYQQTGQERYQQAPPQPAASGPWGGGGAASGGPSFLRSALSTAAGVAGGALLFQGIERMLGYGGGPFASAGLLGGGMAGQPMEEVVVNNFGTDPNDRFGTGNVGADQGGGNFDPNADQIQNADYTADDPGTDSGSDDFGGDGGFDDGGSI
jgi:hypothetical protein